MKNKRNKLHFRQGDVGIWKIDNLNGKKLIPRKPTDHIHVLAYGEATGHHHGINLLDFPDVEMFDIVGEAEYIRIIYCVYIQDAKLQKRPYKVLFQ
jgi:hypothetical protein